MSNAINSNGSKTVSDSVTDAKELKKQQLLEAKRAKEAEKVQQESWEELDYTPCKTIHQAMLIMMGERVEHSEAVKGLCAIGKVILQIGDKRMDFGMMTRETLQIDAEAMTRCFECGFESEDVIAIAQDAKKAWCLGYKTQESLDKANRDKVKRQSKIDKQKALLDKLKGK
ncbi:hypothetical protein [Allocoleopsis sp.]|uniref:hypothetical protein n=1 Tax=Allocoleopsis sp. TaxID=3088169 RepID=UPI002FD5929E